MRYFFNIGLRWQFTRKLVTFMKYMFSTFLAFWAIFTILCKLNVFVIYAVLIPLKQSSLHKRVSNFIQTKSFIKIITLIRS